MQDKIMPESRKHTHAALPLLVDHIYHLHFAFLHLLLVLALQLLSLGLNTFLSPLASSLGLRTLGVHLLLEQTLTLLLSLGLVNLV